jgi:tRNA (cytidine/uridine-2'-O-)-methyltransferase
MISIALLEPKIPQNTGNISRLVIGLDIDLILIGKLGFSLNDRYLKRAGLDYWENLKLKVFDDFETFLRENKDRRLIIATTKGKNAYFDFQFKENDIILFGSETHGVPVDFIKNNLDNTITIPMTGKVRSLNLSNSVAVVAYHSLCQLGYFKNFKVNINFNELDI